MEKHNFVETLSSLKMDQAKEAASSLQTKWSGLDQSKSAVAGSYTDGKSMEINESASFNNPNTSFPLGLLNNILALRNSALNDLPEAKIVLEKYLNALTVKGIDEGLLIESFIAELSHYNWENSARKTLKNLTSVVESNSKEIEVVKAIDGLRRSGGRNLFSDIEKSMITWLKSGNRVFESLTLELKRWTFNPIVKGLLHNVSILESKNSGKFALRTDNTNCEVKSIIAPSLVKESYSVHVIGGRFLKVKGKTISIMEKSEVSKLPGSFLNAVLSLTDSSVRINENGVDLFAGKSRISIVMENNLTRLFINGKEMSMTNPAVALSMELRNSFQDSALTVEKAMNLLKYTNYLAEVDFGRNISSKVYEGVQVNLFKLDNKVFVQRVNPAMKKNELFEANGTQAVNLVKEFVGFDISESMTEYLTGEDKVRSIMYNDRKLIAENLKLVESELAKIDHAINTNPLVSKSEEILNAKEMLVKESNILKSRWNEINVEIERFEKGSRNVSINEHDGYAINTPVKIKRSGYKGVIVGVDGNSKTYTVMQENGTTGEYFFNDVTDSAGEIADIEIDNNEDLGTEVTEGKQEQPNMVKAPGKSAATPKKFVENLDDHELADADVKKTGNAKETKKPVTNPGLSEAPAPKAGAKGAKFIEKEANANLAEAPGGEAKGSGKFINNLKHHNLSLVEGEQKNDNYEKAPEGKKQPKAKKFVEDFEDHQLAEAPGDHKKDGKNFTEDLKRATLAEAPSKKK
jgi:hypothetical protein